MKRGQFITLLGGAATWPLAARAQQTDRVRRIGLLMPSANDAVGQSLAKAFQQGLAQLGWIEGRNLRIDIRWGNADLERYKVYAAEPVNLAPDVIVTASNSATTIVSQQTRTIPIVFTSATDPIETGLVRNMARPGGNVTGFTQLEVGFLGRYVELLKEIAPQVTRIAALHSPGVPLLPAYQREVNAAASLAVQTTYVPARDPRVIEQSIGAFSHEANGGLVALSGPAVTANRELIIALASRYRLPAIYPYRYFVAAGGLMFYGPDLVDQYRRSASYVDRILKGEKPGDLPVQAPTKFEMAINLKTAKALGLTVPDTLLALADEVIE
jgi:putative tryptophan/tyrosine transport system substrate-binding protein